MLLSEAVLLLNHNISKEKSTWADIGCGDGLFTNALSQLLPAQSLIYAADKNKRSLNNVTVKEEIQLEKMVLNFVSEALPFTNLSGILMANAFHFVKDKHVFINKAFKCLQADGYFIIIEYNTDKSNLWVPYPISFNNLKNFFSAFDYNAEKLQEMPSRYHGKIYSAIIKHR